MVLSCVSANGKNVKDGALPGTMLKNNADLYITNLPCIASSRWACISHFNKTKQTMSTCCACHLYMLTFKSVFSKACSRYLAKNLSTLVTPDFLASLAGETWPSTFTAVNVKAGFKKTGVYPLNAGEVTDQHSTAGSFKSFLFEISCK